MSRPEGERWLPVKGRPTVCRRGSCSELAVDAKVGLCAAHRRLQAAPGDDQHLRRLDVLPKGLGGRPGPWARLAACRDTPEDIDFFADSRDRASIEQTELAKEVCRDCIVAASCLAAGLREPYGVWGGMDARERRALRRRRQQAA